MLSMRNVGIDVGDRSPAYAPRAVEKQVWWRYAVRNALIPNVTGFGMALFVLSGALLTEMVWLSRSMILADSGCQRSRFPFDAGHISQHYVCGSVCKLFGRHLICLVGPKDGTT